jgi:hypothetical protein
VLVKKVPGTLHFGARSEGHSFDHAWMNMTHVVHSFYYGSRPTVKKYYQLQVRAWVRPSFACSAASLEKMAEVPELLACNFIT